jgi:hypothetical protein
MTKLHGVRESGVIMQKQGGQGLMNSPAGDLQSELCKLEVFPFSFFVYVSIAWNAPSPSLLARDQSSHQRFARNGFALVFKTRSQSSNFATQSTLYEC